MNAPTVLALLDGWGFAAARALLSLLWQTSILFAAAAALDALLRRRRPGARQRLWLLALFLVPVLPLLSGGARQAGAPQAPVPLLPVYHAPEPAPALPVASPRRIVAPLHLDHPAAVPDAAAPAASAPPSDVASSAPIKPTSALNAPAPAAAALAPRLFDYPWALGLAAYGAGLGYFLLLIALGHRRIRRWVAASAPVQDERTLGAFAEAAGRLGLRRPCPVREGADVPAPLTLGPLRPRVLLPRKLAAGLGDEDLLALALHEQTHARRRDPLALTVAALARAALFFHPLAWVAARRIATLAELAADDAVLEATGHPMEYARMLARLAEALPPRARAAELATGLVPHRGAFLRRIEAILGDRSSIRALTRRGLFAVAAALAFSLALAVALPLAERLPAAYENAPAAGKDLVYRLPAEHHRFLVTKVRRFDRLEDGRGKKLNPSGLSIAYETLVYENGGLRFAPSASQLGQLNQAEIEIQALPDPGEVDLPRYDLVEYRVFEHATRQLIVEKHANENGSNDRLSWNIHLFAPGGKFPSAADVWMRIRPYDPRDHRSLGSLHAFYFDGVKLPAAPDRAVPEPALTLPPVTFQFNGAAREMSSDTLAQLKVTLWTLDDTGKSGAVGSDAWVEGHLPPPVENAGRYATFFVRIEGAGGVPNGSIGIPIGSLRLYDRALLPIPDTSYRIIQNVTTRKGQDSENILSVNYPLAQIGAVELHLGPDPNAQANNKLDEAEWKKDAAARGIGAIAPPGAAETQRLREAIRNVAIKLDGPFSVIPLPKDGGTTRALELASGGYPVNPPAPDATILRMNNGKVPFPRQFFHTMRLRDGSGERPVMGTLSDIPTSAGLARVGNHEDIFLAYTRVPDLNQGHDGVIRLTLVNPVLAEAATVELKLSGDLNRSDPLTPVFRSANLLEPRLAAEREFLERVKYAFGCVDGAVAAAHPEDPRFAFDEWRRDNDKVENGPIRIRKFKGTPPLGHPWLDYATPLPGTMLYISGEGLVAWDRKAGVWWVALVGRGPYPRVEMVASQPERLLLNGGQDELIVLDTKGWTLRRFPIREGVVEELSAPYPEFRDDAIKELNRLYNTRYGNGKNTAPAWWTKSVEKLALAGDFAWGPVINGLQAGLAWEGVTSPLVMDGTAIFRFQVRNAGDTTVTLEYDDPPNLIGNGWETKMSAAAGQSFTLRNPPPANGAQILTRVLGPGERVVVGRVFVELRPFGWEGTPRQALLTAPSGRYRLSQTLGFSLRDAYLAERRGLWRGTLTSGEVALEAQAGAAGAVPQSLTVAGQAIAAEDVKTAQQLLDDYVQQGLQGPSMDWDMNAWRLKRDAWEARCKKLSAGAIRYLQHEAAAGGAAEKRSAAIQALQIAGRADREVMLPLLTDPARDVRYHAIESLGVPGARENVDPLLKVLAGDAEMGDVRAGAIRALGQIGDPRAVQGIIKAVQGNPDLSIQDAAVGVLAAFGDPAAIPVLESLTSATKDWISSGARNAIGRIREQARATSATQAAGGAGTRGPFDSLILTGQDAETNSAVTQVRITAGGFEPRVLCRPEFSQDPWRPLCVRGGILYGIGRDIWLEGIDLAGGAVTRYRAGLEVDDSPTEGWVYDDGCLFSLNVGGARLVVRIIDLARGAWREISLPGDGEPLRGHPSLAASPDHRYLATFYQSGSADRDFRLLLIDLASGKAARPLKDAIRFSSNLALSDRCVSVPPCAWLDGATLIFIHTVPEVSAEFARGFRMSKPVNVYAAFDTANGTVRDLAPLMGSADGMILELLPQAPGLYPRVRIKHASDPMFIDDYYYNTGLQRLDRAYELATPPRGVGVFEKNDLRGQRNSRLTYGGITLADNVPGFDWLLSPDARRILWYEGGPVYGGIGPHVIKYFDSAEGKVRPLPGEWLAGARSYRAPGTIPALWVGTADLAPAPSGPPPDGWRSLKELAYPPASK